MRAMVATLRYSLRMLRKDPGLTAAVLLILTLGIGATTAVYTVIYATLLAPLPYPEPQQLMIVWSLDHGQRNVVSAGDFLDWRQQNSSFQQMAAWSGGSLNVATGDQPEQLSARWVTPGYFNMQGIRFLSGRDFRDEEGLAGGDHEVVLTYKLWNRLGADRAAVGHTMRINGEPYTVVGVLAPGLADRLGPELMVPRSFTPAQVGHDYHWLSVMGRLKPGVSRAEAQQNMDAVAARITAAYPASNRGWGVSVEPLKNDFLPPDRIHNLWLLLGAVGFVLLITCVNIANLLLAKGAARQREIAIRSSMGATRGAIFVQFLTESLLLAAGGGLLGVALGVALLRVIVGLVPEGILPSEANFHLDLPVLAAAVAATTIAGVLFGCAPAWYASRVDPAESLKAGGRSSTGASAGSLRLRRLLIVGEFSLALTLLAGAGLAIHSFWNLTRADLGVRTEHVLTFGLSPRAKQFASPAEIDLYNERMLGVLRGVPGVSSAATVTGMPLRGTADGMPFRIVGGRRYADPSERPDTGFQSVSPDYFRTFGIELLRGRVFSDQDTATGVRVAIVNQEFVRRYLHDVDPLRQRIAIQELIPGAPQIGPEVEWQVVGVAHDVRGGDFREPSPEVDVPFAQSLAVDVNIGVRTALDPAAVTRSVAAAVHAVDAEVALAHVRTMDQVKADALGEDRFTMRLFASFAAVALLLAGVGLYGLMAYTVAQRTPEIGLRLALGAPRESITGLVLREALLLALPGLGLGLGGAVLVGRTMRTGLYGVGSLDVSAMAAVAALLVVTALVASYVPARRAAAIDPMQALRTE